MIVSTRALWPVLLLAGACSSPPSEGSPDAASLPDAAVPDAGAIDGGATDGGATDGGTTDAGTPDHCSQLAAATLTLPAPGEPAVESQVHPGDAAPERAGRCASNQRGPDVVIQFDVPRRLGVEAFTARSPGLVPAAPAANSILSFRRDCAAPSTELACTRAGVQGQPILRQVLEPGRWWLVVSSPVPVRSPLTLGLRTFEEEPGSTCAAPLLLTPATPAGGQVAVFGTMKGSGCGAGDERARFFAVDVPAGKRLGVTASGFAPLNLNLFADCAADRCLAPATSSLGQGSLASWINTGAATRRVLFSVSPAAGDPELSFDVSVRILDWDPLPPEASCEGARDLAPGDPAVTLEALKITEAVVPSRLGGLTPAGWVRTTVPAHTTLVALARPTGGVDATLELLPGGCANASVAGVDAVGPSRPERLYWSNGSDAPRTVVVAVGVKNPRGGSVAVSFSTQPAPFTSSRVEGGCVDTTGGTTQAIAGEGAGPIAALPFELPFVGEKVTHYAVSPSGYVALFTGAEGVVPDGRRFPAHFPDPSGPNRVVAPYWAALRASTVEGAQPAIRVATLGSAPNRRFAVEWIDLALDFFPESRLDFQAVLDEGTGTIELRYCQLDPGSHWDPDALSGRAASVGVEDANGERGVEVAWLSRGAIATDLAYRLVPVAGVTALPARPPEAYCGDSHVDDGETCDAGENNSEAPDAACRPSCARPSCGDRTVDTAAGEQCDFGEGNGRAGLPCDAHCKWFCGNGARDPGEDCDEGAANSIAPDAQCRPSCRVRTCGDGIVDRVAGETCDLGFRNGQGPECDVDCHATCGDGTVQAELGEVCDEGAANSSAPDAACRAICLPRICGDGIVDVIAGEACDEGPSNGGFFARCDVSCHLHCGDGVLQAEQGEECDDGAANADLPGKCRTTCRTAACGDGVLDAGETCDEGANNGISRTATCRPDCSPARCGDGVLDHAEGCDAGDYNGEPGTGCDTQCRPTCGNGDVEAGEECDLGEGNATAPDRCRPNCRLPLCGDGIVDRNEACDDGPRNAFVPDACRPNCDVPRCGDGLVDPRSNEQCDAGEENGKPGASCSLACQRR